MQTEVCEMDALYQAVEALRAEGVHPENARFEITSRTLNFQQEEIATDQIDAIGYLSAENGVVCICFQSQPKEEQIIGTTRIVIAPARMNALIDRDGQFRMCMPIERRVRNAVDYHTPFGLVKAYTTGLMAEGDFSGLYGSVRLGYLLEFEDFKNIMTVDISVSPAYEPEIEYDDEDFE